MVGTDVSINGGNSITTVVETVVEPMKAPSSNNSVNYVSNGKQTSKRGSPRVSRTNGGAAKTVSHTNGSANGIAAKSGSHGNGAANGRAWKIVLPNNGTANGSAGKSVSHASRAANRSPTNTALHTNGAATGSAAKSVSRTNGAANGNATKAVSHTKRSSNGSAGKFASQNNGAANGSGTKTVLHANGDANGIAAKTVMHTNGDANGSAAKTVMHANGTEKEAPKTDEESKMRSKTEEKKKSGRHAGVGHKTILQSEALNQYILETTVYPREHEQLRELRLMTAKHPWNLMLSPADEGQFLQVLLKLMDAMNTIEIGTYTGYSLLATALALPANGKILAMDLNRECLDLGWPYIEKAGVANKITFVGGPALDSLDELLKDEKNHNFFDFVFVDADKNNYMNYHERLLKLVRVGGLIGYDNTLWNGTVVASDEDLKAMPKYIRFYQPFINELNRYLGQDPRVQPTLVSIGDGVTLCRRVL